MSRWHKLIEKDTKRKKLRRELRLKGLKKRGKDLKEHRPLISVFKLMLGLSIKRKTRKHQLYLRWASNGLL